MDVGRPYAAVTGGGLEGEVLAVLAKTTRPLSGRQIARLADRGSDRGLRLALNRLADQGLVDRTNAPPSVLYTLNRDHIAAPLALALVDLRSALFERVRSDIAGWEIAPPHASVFGSAARGDGDTRSDIDVFIVRPRTVAAEDATWQAQVDALARGISRWTGNHAGISEVGEDDLDALVAARPPVVEELERDAVVLAGPDARRLLKRARASTA